MSDMFAAVVFNVPVDKAFHYSIPDKLKERVKVGARVRVPFRKSAKTGFVAALVDHSDVGYAKPVWDVLDDEPLVDAAMLDLARWIADYTLCSWGEALTALVPPGARSTKAAKTIRHVELETVPLFPLRSAPQTRIVEYLRGVCRAVAVREVLERTGATHSQIKTLVEKGVLRERHVKADPDLFSEAQSAPSPEVKLTDEQAAALREIEERLARPNPGVVLLHGVTGSGKTEVYLRAMQRALSLGKRSIFLVPEVALTPQTFARVHARFARVAVLHSTLTPADRGEEWRKARRGDVDVVVGARSAAFAPLKNLGIIVVDEEHEATYKQDSVPRYHAREVAVERGRREGALVILGSATPSLESFAKAQSGEFGLLALTRRVRNLPMPAVTVVDMSAESSAHRGPPILSRRLQDAVREALGRNEQIIIFLNRRGYASFSRCAKCGYLVRCRRCEVALNYHRDRARWLCHHCLDESEVPSNCPKCRQGKLGMFGIGTEKVEQELKRIFPEPVVRRMDSDAMKTRDDYRESLGQLWSGETDILVGTQMIAKGLDVPDVTVVGIVSADTALALPDFRAAERTFQLVTQVAGRAGRGPRGGTVYVQTLNSGHYGIALAAANDYAGFAQKELAMRRDLGFPPFGHLIRIVGEGSNEEDLRARMAEIGRELRALIPEREAVLWGPAPAPLPKLRGRHRHHVLLKCADLASVQKKLKGKMSDLLKSAAVRIAVDVDPISLV